MNNSILFISITLLMSLTSCMNKSAHDHQSAEGQKADSSKTLTQEQKEIEEGIAKHQALWKDIVPYSIDFNIEQLENNEFKLNVIVEPDEGSYALSHFASDDFSGKFRIKLPETSDIKLVGTISETPPTEAIYEPWSKEYHKAITSKTVCSQKFSINSSSDFQVTGSAEFTIEPKCTYEKNAFIIVSKGGEVSIQISC